MAMAGCLGSGLLYSGRGKRRQAKMQDMKKFNAVVVGALAWAVAMGAVLVPAPTRAQDKPPTRITFSLDFIPLGRHAPWYAAIAEGYYKQEGLDVSIIPSAGTAQTIQAIEAGTAQIGFTDLPSVALARAQGVKVKMVAVNYEKAPYAIFSLSPGANVTHIKQLNGLALGSGAGSFTPKVIAGLMSEHCGPSCSPTTDLSSIPTESLRLTIIWRRTPT